MVKNEIRKFQAEIEAFGNVIDKTRVELITRKVAMHLQDSILAEINRHDPQCKKQWGPWVIKVT